MIPDDEEEEESEFDDYMDDETKRLIQAMDGPILHRLFDQLHADLVEWDSTGVVPDWQRRKYLGYD